MDRIVANIDVCHGSQNDCYAINYFASRWRNGVPDVARALRAFFVLFFFAITPLCRATSIVFFWTPEQIVIAADSMFSHGVENRPTEGCKIRKIGPFFYATAGLLEDPSVGFNLPSIIQDSDSRIVPGEDFFGRAGLINTFIEFALIKAQQARGKKSVVDKSWLDSANYTDHFFLMAGVEDSNVFASYDFASITDVEGKKSFSPSAFESLRCPKNSPADYSAYVQMNEALTKNGFAPHPLPVNDPFCWGAMGQRDAIFSYISTHPNWLQFDLVTLAKRFIDMEKVDSPTTVGFRTVVLTI